MPVVGVASKLRQPSGGSKPVHTALPIPNPGRGPATQGYMSRTQELRGSEPPAMSCHLSLKSEYQDRRSLQPRSKETEESKICKVSVNMVRLSPPGWLSRCPDELLCCVCVRVCVWMHQ